MDMRRKGAGLGGTVFTRDFCRRKPSIRSRNPFEGGGRFEQNSGVVHALRNFRRRHFIVDSPVHHGCNPFHENAFQFKDLREADRGLVEESVADFSVDDFRDLMFDIGKRYISPAMGSGFDAIGHHYDCRLGGIGASPGIPKRIFIDTGRGATVLFRELQLLLFGFFPACINQAVPVMRCDNIFDGGREVFSEGETIVHMGTDDQGGFEALFPVLRVHRIARKIFDEHLGIGEFADIVVKAADPSQHPVGTDSLGGIGGEFGDIEGMRIGSGGLFLELFEEREIRIFEKAQADIAGGPEQIFQNRHDGQCGKSIDDDGAEGQDDIRFREGECRDGSVRRMATQQDVEQDAHQLEATDQGENFQQIGTAIDGAKKPWERNADNRSDDQNGKNGFLRDKKEILYRHGNTDCDAGAAAYEHGRQGGRKQKGHQERETFAKEAGCKTRRKEMGVIGGETDGDDQCRCLQDIGQRDNHAEQRNPGIPFEHEWRELTEQEAGRQG